MKKTYVLGFMFTPDLDQVLLLRKAKPKHLSGKLNGIGGLVEDEDADVFEAMARECEEETGFKIPGADWSYLCTMQFKNLEDPDDEWGNAEVVCFYTVYTHEIHLYTRRPPGPEPLALVSVINLPNLNVVYNLNWLVTMARDKELFRQKYPQQEMSIKTV